MAEPRDDVPLADLEEQQRALDTEPDVDEGEDLPEAEPHSLRDEANEADVVEQWIPVNEGEDYPRDTAEQE
ncbi:MAG TPA: hypothetical protein VFG97_09555 [Pedococcus sp.]|jgi:hypothetical protein|nr:hypothetical protein [Pedococcus sp.]